MLLSFLLFLLIVALVIAALKVGVLLLFLGIPLLVAGGLFGTKATKKKRLTPRSNQIE